MYVVLYPLARMARMEVLTIITYHMAPSETKCAWHVVALAFADLPMQLVAACRSGGSPASTPEANANSTARLPLLSILRLPLLLARGRKHQTVIKVKAKRLVAEKNSPNKSSCYPEYNTTQ